MPVKYENGKIYKIFSHAGPKIYIGSTSDLLCRRMTKHRGYYKEKDKPRKNGRMVYISSFELFDEYGVENCEIMLIENYPCKTKAELHKKEGEHIKNNECVNKTIPGRKIKEWREDKKEHIKNYSKKYYNENVEKLKIKAKKYYDENIEECRKKSRIRGMKKVECECGSIVLYTHFARHKKSDKHINGV